MKIWQKNVKDDKPIKSNLLDINNDILDKRNECLKRKIDDKTPVKYNAVLLPKQINLLGLSTDI